MRVGGMRLRTFLGRRLRTARFARSTFLFGALSIGALVLLSGVFMWTVADNWAGGATARSNGAPPFSTPGNPAGSLVSGASADGPEGSVQPLTGYREAAPYTESLEELLRLLRIYAEHRGVRVNSTYHAQLEAIAAVAGLSNGADDSKRGAGGGVADLQLPGVNLLHHFYSGIGHVVGHLSADWALDDPKAIVTEQEAYVEQYLVPTQAEVRLTPLRVIASYYNARGSRSLDRMAAETEKAMNDDGYATYMHRSPTFYDVSHAARRGYGQEGSIFVAVPFTLADITAEMVDTIRHRATAASMPQKTTPNASSGAAPQEGDDLVGDDGFQEWRHTAARCAVTVESIFRNAHRGVSVAVGTIDVVVVSGITTAAELPFATPADVSVPLRAADRAPLSLARKRRYSRITCEPPDFASGWDDANYGFRWKDNLRRRRVVVPLTRLDSEAANDATLLQREDIAALLGQYLDIAYVGRLATLQLYRGESYILLLRTGAVTLPKWDLALRLLYLRTPVRDRAVLSGRPTPGVVWTALAASIARVWASRPYLRLSLETASSRRSAAGEPSGGRRNRTAVPPPDEFGERLLAALPVDVSAWLSAARAEAALVLWLVTPGWLWPTLVETLADWRQIAAAPELPPSTTAPSALRLLFGNATFGDATVDELLTLREVDVKTVQVDVVRRSDSANATNASPLRNRRVHVRGGENSAVSSVPQAVLSASLTESEVYKAVLLTEKRPPMPAELTTLMAQAASTKAPAQPRTPRAAMRLLCGEETSGAPYYSALDRALVKRSFEDCWLKEHRGAVQQQVRRILRSTQATTVLKAAPGTKPPPAGAVAAAKCRPKKGFSKVEVVPRSSVCLEDMRYLVPLETPTCTGAGGGLYGRENSTHQELNAANQRLPLREEAWLTSAADVGTVHGVPTSTCVSETADGADEPTPYVLQSVASAELLFGPAEVFFNFAPEHRLRTRARSLSEQLAERRRRHPGAEAATAHAQVPEAVELDPSLPFMDSDQEDVYMTQALWTRGWNIFGLTEPVAVGLGESELLSSAAAKAPVICAGEDTEQQRIEQEADDVPPELRHARTFTHDKFWALLTDHREAGTPLGVAQARNGTTPQRAASQSLHPLRRTIKEWEVFSGVPWPALREAFHGP
ncbi:hypothetical protein LSCM1_08244 [Leishmania martiniquensis]|uniref:Uncharacterized protein n=1 Tax=Leishmania martiniquensis TaxID=1580590 RepID=A0A836HAP6_9TRYP|nr:hypothetical protein LSCM1_08244 [Leishmania martiniquensis]